MMKKKTLPHRSSLRRLPTARVAAALLGLATATSLSAQEKKQSESKKLAEVVVEAEKDAPTQVTIKAEQIQNTLAMDLDDLFAGNPQVLVGGGIPAAQKIYVRGFEDKLLNVSIDGATQAGYLTHHQSQFIIVPELMKQVTVSAGPGAATNGPGTLAGSIRMEHKGASDFLKDGQDFGMFLKSGYHSNGDGFQQTAAIYGRISETWSALAAFTYFDVGDYKDGNGNTVPLTAHTQRTGFVRVDGQLTDEQKLSLTYERAEDDGVYFHRPNFTGFFAHPRASNVPVANHTLRDTATLKYELDPDSQLVDLKATLFYSHYRIDRETQYEMGVESLGFDLRNTSKLGRHAITYGMDYRRDFTEFTGKGRSTGFVLPVTYTTAPDEVLGILGLYFQDEWQILDPLTLSFGLRYDNYEFTDFLGQKFGDSGFSPNVGVTWQVTQPLALYARYAQSFRGVTPIDSITRSEGGTTNRAGTHGETAHNVDGGFRYDDGTFFGTGSVFHQAIDDAIVTSGGTRGNGGHLESWGYFAEIGVRHGGLQARLSVSQSFPRFNGAALSDVDFGFGTSTGRAWRAAVDYTFEPWRVSCGYELSYVEGFDAVPAGIPGKSPYCVSNLYANWKPLKGHDLTLQLAITNLFDRFYVDQTTSGYNAALARVSGLPAQGFGLRLAVAYQF